MHDLRNQQLDDCSSCNKEYANIWRYLRKRIKKYVIGPAHSLHSSLVNDWLLYECGACSNKLLLKNHFSSSSFNTRFDINYRFITQADMQVLNAWTARSFPAQSIFEEKMTDIGASPKQWYEEGEITPCKVVHKNADVFPCVEYVNPETPPLPNRKVSNAEEPSFWSKYQGIILLEEVAKIEPSPFAMSYSVRANYEDYYFPMVERVSAAFLNIKDKSGNMVTINVPPSHWCDDEAFDNQTAEPISTSEGDYHSILKPFSKPLYVLV